MHRFFVEPSSIKANLAYIEGSEAGHIFKVLRLKTGDRIIVCDGEGYEYEGPVIKCTNVQVIVEIENMKINNTEPDIEVILAQGIAKKNDKIELTVQKSTELGVSKFVPLLTERMVVNFDEDKICKRRQRWQKIAFEAAKQSGRAVVPKVEQPVSVQELLRSIQRDTFCIVPWEEEKVIGVSEVLKKEAKNRFKRPAAVFIGPEGGFTPEEINEMRRAGVIPVSLGPRTLRTETAGIISLGLIMYELADLGGARRA